MQRIRAGQDSNRPSKPDEDMGPERLWAGSRSLCFEREFSELGSQS